MALPLTSVLTLMVLTAGPEVAQREALEPPSELTILVGAGAATMMSGHEQRLFTAPAERLSVVAELDWPSAKGDASWLGYRLGLDFERIRAPSLPGLRSAGAHAGCRMLLNLGRTRLWALFGMGLRSEWSPGRAESSALSLESLLGGGVDVRLTPRLLAGLELASRSTLLSPRSGVGFSLGVRAGYRF